MTEDIAISVSNLSKNYSLRSSNILENKKVTNDFTALNNVSFDIRKGESVAIIGANGSGKSTLLKILAGVTKPTSGIIKLNGSIASILDVGAGFHPELSGRENIFVNAQLLGFSKKEIEPKVDEIIEFSGIGNFINEPVKNYSNGMFLRLAFSIVVHLEFDIYLFDEVLGVGDAEFRYLTSRKLNQLKNDKLKTIIYVSHEVSSIVNVCDKFLELNSGSMISYGKAEIIKNYIKKSSKRVLKDFPNGKATITECDFFMQEGFRINAVRVFAKEDSIKENREFNIQLEADRVVAKELDFSFGIEDLTGKILFGCSTLFLPESKNLSTNKLLINFTIPAFTLTSGNYILNLTAIIDMTVIKLQFQKILCFTIESNVLESNPLLISRPNYPFFNK